MSTSFEEKDGPIFPNQRASTGIPLKTQPVTKTKSYSADFHCSWGLIPITFKCDGTDNCGDNSDEENCPGAGGKKLLMLRTQSAE